jgi:putative tryptophan/tyrosine transport system substrate-binding protein
VRARSLPSLSLLLALFLLGLGGPGTPALAAQITVVLSEEAAVYREAEAALRTALDDGHSVRTVTAGQFDANPPETSKGSSMLVAIGVRAARAVSVRDMEAPVMALLLPKQAFERLPWPVTARRQRRFSAVYLDQPLGRHFSLMRAMLPAKHRVGVVLGQESAGLLAALQTEAKAADFVLKPERLDAAEDLIPVLQTVLQSSDVLLVLPDPLVVNPSSIQHLLLTAYRYRVPVLAYSESYVKAGALAAVFSTPEQIGRQAGELINRALKDGGVLPAPEYPVAFSVKVNRHVARALGVEVPDEAQMLKNMYQSAGTGL